MENPHEFDDPGPIPYLGPSRLRRALRIAVLILLIVSMTFLAWISGRGELRVTPAVPPTAVPITAAAIAPCSCAGLHPG